MGRQWFALTFRDPHERWRGVNHAGPGLDRLARPELASHNLPASTARPRRLQPGHHDGAAPCAPAAEPVAAVVGYSGMLVLEEGKGADSLKAAVRSKPPILLIHGDQDDLIPLDALFISGETLAAAEVACEWHLSAGIGHGIDGEGLRHGGLFLRRAFGLPYPK
jgi:phospholipase/carboxylesterase